MGSVWGAVIAGVATVVAGLAAALAARNGGKITTVQATVDGRVDRLLSEAAEQKDLVSKAALTLDAALGEIRGLKTALTAARAAPAEPPAPPQPANGPPAG